MSRRTRNDPVNALNARLGHFQHYGAKDAPGFPLNAEFPNSAEYLQTIWHARMDKKRVTPMSMARHAAIRNALSTAAPGEGGFLIPEAMRTELLDLSLEHSIVRSRAQIVPVKERVTLWPLLDTTDRSGNFGGIDTTPMEQGNGTAVTTSEPDYAQMRLEVQKIPAAADVPNELISDGAGGLNVFIGANFSRALARKEDDLFMFGTGAGEPLGALTAGNPAAITVEKESGQTAATIVAQNVANMMARFVPSSFGRAVWVCNQETLPELLSMGIAVGTAGSGVAFGEGDGLTPFSIHGIPLYVSDLAPVLGDAGDLCLVDFAYYLIADLRAITMRTSGHYKFGNDVTTVHMIELADGRPWLPGPITPKNGSSTVSPFVRLGARA